MPNFNDLDTEMKNQLVKKYIKANKVRRGAFNFQHFKAWVEQICVIDNRPNDIVEEQTPCKVLTLTEILQMSDEEADKWNVLEYKKEFMKEANVKEMDDEKFINGQTYEEMLGEYLRETGRTLDDDVNEREFLKWVDGKVHQHLDKEYPDEIERKRSHKLYDIIDSFVSEVGFDDDNKIDYSKFKDWAKRKSLKIPKEIEAWANKPRKKQQQQ